MAGFFDGMGKDKLQTPQAQDDQARRARGAYNRMMVMIPYFPDILDPAHRSCSAVQYMWRRWGARTKEMFHVLSRLWR